MSIAFVQALNGQGFGPDPAATITGVTLTGGNAVVGLVMADDAGAGTITSITDPSNNYAILAQATINSRRAALFTKGNVTAIAGGTLSVNFLAPDGNWSVSIAEYSGALASANPVDNSGAALVLTSVATPGAGTPDGVTTGNFTSVTNGCMIVGFGMDAPAGGLGQVLTAGTGFTHRPGGDGTLGEIVEDLLQATASASTKATFTSSTNAASFIGAVALAPAGGGGGDTFANAGSIQFMRDKIGGLFKPERKLILPGWRPEPAWSF